MILYRLRMDSAQKSKADVYAEVEAKLREYFSRYEEGDYAGIIENVYAPPINIGLSNARGHIMNAEDAMNNLTGLKKRTREDGWVASPITSINTHILTEGLVFADLSYRRRKAGDDPETQDVSIVYVLQDLDKKGWRVTSFYMRDQNKPVVMPN
jgi:hypothetical protein